jgi:hypothetical protein
MLRQKKDPDASISAAFARYDGRKELTENGRIFLAQKKT